MTTNETTRLNAFKAQALRELNEFAPLINLDPALHEKAKQIIESDADQYDSMRISDFVDLAIDLASIPS